MKSIQLGLMGCGTVGTGVARLLIQEQNLLQDRVGFPLHLKYVADLDPNRERGVIFGPGVFVSDARRIIEDPEIDIVIEMIGGETLAGDLIREAIAKGKHVVTANKALIAKQGNDLFVQTYEKGVNLAFEASVCGPQTGYPLGSGLWDEDQLRRYLCGRRLRHHAKEADVCNALAQISALDIVSAKPVLIRIEDENEHE